MRRKDIREKIEFLKILLPMMRKELPSFLAQQMWADKYWFGVTALVGQLLIYLVVDPILQYLGISLSNWPYIVAGAISGLFVTQIKAFFEQPVSSENGKLHKIPGWRLGRILHLIYGQRIYSRVVETQLFDHQKEHIEALAAGKLNHARWIWIRCWLILGSAP